MTDASLPDLSMPTLRQVRTTIKSLPRAAAVRLSGRFRRRQRFFGAFDSREAAERVVAIEGGRGYDDAAIADVSFELMCRREVWDYPVIHWLNCLLPDTGHLIDAGGHFGTKYIAFRDMLSARDISWTVFDLPAIVAAARARASKGRSASELAFQDEIGTLAEADILLCSGLLQYQDVPFDRFVASLRHRPETIILNKVAVRTGPEIHTIERIGSGCVPYRIRNRATFEKQLGGMGYEIRDSWSIPDLGHVILSHPWLGRSESRGYVLGRVGGP